MQINKFLLGLLGVVMIGLIIGNVILVVQKSNQDKQDIIQLTNASQNVGMFTYKQIVYQECIKQNITLNFAPIDSAYIRSLKIYQ